MRRATSSDPVESLKFPARKLRVLGSEQPSFGVTLEVPHADPLDMTLRELLHRLLDARSPMESEWINVRTDQLPWRQLVAAAERGEVELSRAGRKLMMRRSELDRWLDSQRIGPSAPATTTEAQPKPPGDVSHLLARLGFGSGTKST